MPGFKRYFLILALLGFMPSSFAAPGVAATGTFKESFSVQRCGKTRGAGTVAMSMFDDGTWTSTLTFEGQSIAYSGTYTVVKAARKFNLSFDSASYNQLVTTLTNWAGYLCDSPVTASNIVVSKFQVVVNKPQTKMGIAVKIKATGSSYYGSGKAAYEWKAAGLAAAPTL